MPTEVRKKKFMSMRRTMRRKRTGQRRRMMGLRAGVGGRVGGRRVMSWGWCRWREWWKWRCLFTRCSIQSRR
uniref:Uncharacterized protein MANES_02G122800 n=1 Tax=Rhizophora mucronata TaxID=61149 RepID=A0A2P2N0E1_RHIMU